MGSQGSGADPNQASLQSSRAPSGENPKAAQRGRVSFADDSDDRLATEISKTETGKPAPAQTDSSAEKQKPVVRFEDVVPVKKEGKKDWVSPFAQSSFQGDHPWHPPTYKGQGTMASAPSAKPSGVAFEQPSVSF